MKLILGLAGEIGSGKGTVAQYLKEKQGASIYRMSDIVRDVLGRIYLDSSRENMQTVSSMLRKNFGEDLFAKVASEDMKKISEEIVVIDAIRREGDMAYLKELPEFKLFYVEVDMKTRYDRLHVRGENPDDNDKTFEQFKKDHEGEPEQQIRGLKKIADFVIINDGSIENLRQQIDKMLSEQKQ